MSTFCHSKALNATSNDQGKMDCSTSPSTCATPPQQTQQNRPQWVCWQVHSKFPPQARKEQRQKQHKRNKNRAMSRDRGRGRHKRDSVTKRRVRTAEAETQKRRGRSEKRSQRSSGTCIPCNPLVRLCCPTRALALDVVSTPVPELHLLRYTISSFSFPLSLQTAHVLVLFLPSPSHLSSHRRKR